MKNKMLLIMNMKAITKDLYNSLDKFKGCNPENVRDLKLETMNLISLLQKGFGKLDQEIDFSDKKEYLIEWDQIFENKLRVFAKSKDEAKKIWKEGSRTGEIVAGSKERLEHTLKITKV